MLARWLIGAACFLALVAVSSCAPAGRPVSDSALERCIDNCVRPTWCDDLESVSTETDKAFCGVSLREPAEQLGRQNARFDAEKQAVDDMGLYAKRKIREAIVAQGSAQNVIDAAVAMIEQTKVTVEAPALGYAAKYVTQTWEDTRTGRRFYSIYALYMVPRNAAEQYASRVLAAARDKATEATVKGLLDECKTAIDEMKAEDW